MNNENRFVILIQGWAPDFTKGSCNPVRRHLERLSLEGYRVLVVAPAHCIEAAKNHSKINPFWEAVPVPQREWWWPPFREGSKILKWIRYRLILKMVKPYTENAKSIHILNVLEPTFWSELAVFVAKKISSNLIVIMHDQPELWESVKTQRPLVRMKIIQNITRFLEYASVVLPVTLDLGKAYRFDHDKIIHLYPIPSKLSDVRSIFKGVNTYCPVIVHAGSLHSFMVPGIRLMANCLRCFNGKFVIYTDSVDEWLSDIINEFGNIEIRAAPVHMDDLLHTIAEEATAFLVCYSFNEIAQPWAKTSFPSRLLEVSQVGMPAIIMAPPNTAIGRWAISHEWPLYLSSLNESQLKELIKNLQNRKFWEDCNEQVVQLALDEFNPDKIHEVIKKCFH